MTEIRVKVTFNIGNGIQDITHTFDNKKEFNRYLKSVKSRIISYEIL